MTRIETPRDRRERFPGKHEVYVYGQASADGMACIGCDWQASGMVGPVPAGVEWHDR